MTTLHHSLALSLALDLGPIEDINIQSIIGPFHRLPHYITTYPQVVVEALGNLYIEYNVAFRPLVELNREWDTDYQHCLPDGNPINWAVQIDMVGLPDQFLQALAEMSESEVREILRLHIFELENSLAMYQLLERIFERNGQSSFFKVRFRQALDALRRHFGKPIALLAVTPQKHTAMRESEFGKRDGEVLTDAEVFELSGFDRLFGPDEFRRYLGENGGECHYLLYARTSDPVAKLRDPKLQVDHPLLSDPVMRRIIKANSITFNVDDPSWATGDPRRINDSKGYMHSMRMALQIADMADLLSPEFSAHLLAGRPFPNFLETGRVSTAFAEHLRRYGLEPDDAGVGKTKLRVKPVQGAYGCYGHMSGDLADQKFRTELRRLMRQRGPYVVQPELTMPTVQAVGTNLNAAYIDRNFFAIVDGRPQFLGGFRSLMPLQTTEAHKGRIHGNGDTVWGEIISRS